MSVLDKLVSPQGQASIASAAALLADIDAKISDIREQLVGQDQETPQAEGVWVPITQGPNGQWQFSGVGSIVALLVTADTSSLYAFQRGGDNQSIQFGLTAWLPQLLDFSGPKKIKVASGLSVDVVQVLGSGAKIYASACFVPGDYSTAAP